MPEELHAVQLPLRDKMATVRLPSTETNGKDSKGGRVYCITEPSRFTRLHQGAGDQVDFYSVRLRKHIGKSQSLIPFPVEKGTSLISLPSIERNAAPAGAKPILTPKKVINRAPSVSESNRPATTRDRYRCTRALPGAARKTDDAMCRHFCELMGPDLCNDCSKRWVQLTSLDEYRQKPCLPQVRGSDPFRDLVISRGSMNAFGSQNQAREEERQLAVVSLSTSEDRGLDSRLGYVQSLARSLTPSSLLDSLLSESERERRAFMQSRRHRSAEVYSKDTSPSPAQRPHTTGSTSPLANNYLAKLCSREGPFKRNVALLYYPNKHKYAWKELPVEPVTMELKLINFTIYDAELKRVWVMRPLPDGLLGLVARTDSIKSSKLLQCKYICSRTAAMQWEVLEVSISTVECLVVVYSGAFLCTSGIRIPIPRTMLDLDPCKINTINWTENYSNSVFHGSQWTWFGGGGYSCMCVKTFLPACGLKTTGTLFHIRRDGILRILGGSCEQSWKLEKKSHLSRRFFNCAGLMWLVPYRAGALLLLPRRALVGRPRSLQFAGRPGSRRWDDRIVLRQLCSSLFISPGLIKILRLSSLLACNLFIGLMKRKKTFSQTFKG